MTASARSAARSSAVIPTPPTANRSAAAITAMLPRHHFHTAVLAMVISFGPFVTFWRLSFRVGRRMRRAYGFIAVWS
ncbi:MAG: hypothetical protein ACLRSW_14355 [Christensenellaceae bacterium]